MSAMDSARIVYTPHTSTSPEVELDALAAVYKFVLFDSQASKGGAHDLTGNSTKGCTTRSDQKGKRNADLHGN
jgi:hypothetical protein